MTTVLTELEALIEYRKSHTVYYVLDQKIQAIHDLAVAEQARLDAVMALQDTLRRDPRLKIETQQVLDALSDALNPKPQPDAGEALARCTCPIFADHNPQRRTRSKYHFQNCPMYLSPPAEPASPDVLRRESRRLRRESARNFWRAAIHLADESYVLEAIDKLREFWLADLAAARLGRKE